MEFKNLTGVDITTIHTAFVDAFGQYAVPMTLSVTDLASMMQLRSYAAEHSSQRHCMALQAQCNLRTAGYDTWFKSTQRFW